METISTIYGRKIEILLRTPKKLEISFFFLFVSADRRASAGKTIHPIRLLMIAVSFDSEAKKYFMAITQREPKTVLTQSIVRNKRFHVHVFERASIIGMLCVLPPKLLLVGGASSESEECGNRNQRLTIAFTVAKLACGIAKWFGAGWFGRC